MAEEPVSKNKDGSRIGSDEYVTLALCIIVPIIGLLLRAAVGWVCRSSRASLLLIEFMKPLTD